MYAQGTIGIYTTKATDKLHQTPDNYTHNMLSNTPMSQLEITADVQTAVLTPGKPFSHLKIEYEEGGSKEYEIDQSPIMTRDLRYMTGRYEQDPDEPDKLSFAISKDEHASGDVKKIDEALERIPIGDGKNLDQKKPTEPDEKDVSLVKPNVRIQVKPVGCKSFIDCELQKMVTILRDNDTTVGKKRAAAFEKTYGRVSKRMKEMGADEEIENRGTKIFSGADSFPTEEAAKKTQICKDKAKK